jgi:hypothetical protein
MKIFYGYHISMNEFLVKMPREHKREQIVINSHHGEEKQR